MSRIRSFVVAALASGAVLACSAADGSRRGGGAGTGGAGTGGAGTGGSSAAGSGAGGGGGGNAGTGGSGGSSADQAVCYDQTGGVCTCDYPQTPPNVTSQSCSGAGPCCVDEPTWRRCECFPTPTAATCQQFADEFGGKVVANCPQAPLAANGPTVQSQWTCSPAASSSTYCLCEAGSGQGSVDCATLSPAATCCYLVYSPAYIDCVCEAPPAGGCAPTPPSGKYYASVSKCPPP